MSARAYLGLGGNVGDARATMAAALKRIDQRQDCSVVAVSRLYRTPPWGKTDQPEFLNACAAVDTRLSPRALLELCLETERAFKRVRAERWGPRTLDIDVLDYDGRPFSDDALTLPHPRIGERAFVLVPLADVARELVIDGATVSARLAETTVAGIDAVTDSGGWWKA
ncbi:2-amino-4-hydroxy-6-hydroxymethyldihydropteridine diphosphokinase [Jiella endophytica]|uniref:2-amino-4-hydroxy-6-hydroxymethyldihydropteridine pyrophosphokinase n=1 Tax=Jiella endophytica TaxID=2558362 RepID=A0A4Y8RSZ5_9HYPH|nr:2-amino-4-hydroxy-6-hydroxymethyldihydropteridine diphosphokinase [Jiella endophytica]TFF27440.1 2-amino-4-hydroxy-6-hydroxymethyldihydropteridine diphosphokinase [Jiella endophytica]